jgi:hypothetical protein
VTFEEWLAQVALGGLTTTDYPAIALQALLEGVESPKLLALAGTMDGERSPFEIQELLDHGLREVGLAIPDRAAAGLVMKRFYARAVAAGALAPSDGAARIVQLASDLSDVLPDRDYAGDGLGVARLLGLYYSHDDVAFNDDCTHAEIDEELLNECRRIAAESAV